VSGIVLARSEIRMGLFDFLGSKEAIHQVKKSGKYLTFIICTLLQTS